MNSATQVRTAASPTRLWKAATSCGKSEISIRLAMVRPENQEDKIESGFESVSYYTERSTT